MDDNKTLLDKISSLTDECMRLERKKIELEELAEKKYNAGKTAASFIDVGIATVMFFLGAFLGLITGCNSYESTLEGNQIIVRNIESTSMRTKQAKYDLGCDCYVFDEIGKFNLGDTLILIKK